MNIPMLGSLYISSYSHLSCIYDCVSTCGFIRDKLLAACEMQISCLTTDHNFRMFKVSIPASSIFIQLGRDYTMHYESMW